MNRLPTALQNLTATRVANRATSPAHADGWAGAEGAPTPLGVTWIPAEEAYNFALYSAHATGVTLLLYGNDEFARPRARYRFDYHINKSRNVWHCRLPLAALRDSKYYAYQVEGLEGRAEGARFDTQKILLDPYARAVFFPPGFDREAARRPGPDAGRAPLGVIHGAEAPFDWGLDQAPKHTFDTVIYELHVKGFTARANSGVPAERRGTFAGLIDKIPYLQELGVTAVELLPVYQYDPQEGNYWGYMPLSFFCPHQTYAGSHIPEEVFNEFRAMVKALHAAGIEVILDVVYNHTAEGDETGPTYSFRGIDNRSYYLLEPDLEHYRNDAGTGNVLRCAHPFVRKLILDSMRLWAKELRVDGFRFDLASLLTRNADGSPNLDDPPVIAEISGDPDLAGVRLIAEAWDISSYQLGRSFPGTTWLQWNGQFRDDVRSFVKSDPGRVRDLLARLYGSDDLFPDGLPEAYHPYQSVNYITSHDGFCLYDLVAYNRKHNDANGHHNTDGTDDNRSWNCGWEGDYYVPPEVLALRRRQVKNLCCLLLLANGTPMFCAGDEFMNTQGGNNNPYNQDNETTWLNWDLLEQNRDIFRFFQQMIAFRKAHPSLGRSRFWRDDVRWYGVGATPDTNYLSHTLAYCLHGASQHDQDIYVLINAYWQELVFTVQEGAAAEWGRVVDTSLPSPDDFAAPGTEPRLDSSQYRVGARSVVVLVRG